MRTKIVEWLWTAALLASTATETAPALRLRSRLRGLRRRLGEWRRLSLLKTLYWNHRCGLPPFTLDVYPNTRVRIDRTAKVIHRGGTLRVGRRWGNGLCRPSELLVAAGAVLEIGGDFDIFTGCSVIVDPGAKLALGSGGMNMCTRVAVFHGLTLGRTVFIGENVTIRDSDNHLVYGGTGVKGAPIVIGNNVFIGLNSVILKGVHIGDGCVVGAGSVVTKSIPPKTMVCGAPVRVIRENVSWRP